MCRVRFRAIQIAKWMLLGSYKHRASNEAVEVVVDNGDRHKEALRCSCDFRYNVVHLPSGWWLWMSGFYWVSECSSGIRGWDLELFRIPFGAYSFFAPILTLWVAAVDSSIPLGIYRITPLLSHKHFNYNCLIRRWMAGSSMVCFRTEHKTCTWSIREFLIQDEMRKAIVWISNRGIYHIWHAAEEEINRVIRSDWRNSVTRE